MNLIWLFILSLIAGYPLGPKSPEDDDFYDAPIGFENQTNGAILKSRLVPQPLTDFISDLNVKSAWQLLVKSQDTFGNPNAFVTTIIEPYNADANKIVSYLPFEDSADPNCTISYAIQKGAPTNTLESQVEMFFVAALLNQGYFVNIPDYEGPKSAFTVGLQSGQAVLNSIRATLSSGNITGISSDAKVSAWGYSGGSLAGVFAAGIQPIYAPELLDNLVGFSLGGLVTNLTATLEVCDGSLFSGIVANALSGLIHEYSQYTSFLDSKINPSLMSEWEQSDKHCLVDSVAYYAFKHWITGSPRFFNDGPALLSEDPTKSIVGNNSIVNLKNLVPKVPIFIYQGTLDNIVPIASSLKTYQQWCDAGVESVEFAEDALNGHITEAVVGAPAALTWIVNRMNGVAPVKGCQHTKRLSNFFYPNLIPSLLDYFKAGLDTILGLNLGGDIQKDELTLEGLQRLQNMKA